MKTIITDNDCVGEDEVILTRWYECPICKDDYIAERFRYCPNCGAKLEWQLGGKKDNQQIKGVLDRVETEEARNDQR